MSKNKAINTWQWATKTINCCTGCSHDCLYCYAKSMAIRFKQVTAAQWPLERIRMHDVNRKQQKVSGPGIYNRYQDNPMIKWKNGVKKIVGLPMATVPGLDI
jgi:DNA repair photolyase